jgi:hypothetical protein
MTPLRELYMDFLRENAGTIVVGMVVFAILVLILIRMIVNARKGKSSCGCGCDACAKRG